MQIETVPIKPRSGEYRFWRWLGFIDRITAKQSSGVPCAIKIDAYALEEAFPKWIQLADHQHIQGCHSFKWVYAVTGRGTPRVLN